MIIYNYHENITLEELNVLAGEGWEVVGIVGGTDPPKIDAWVKAGYQDLPQPVKEQYTLVENTETGAKFYLNTSFSYGDAMIITFITIFFFAFLGKIIFNYFFYNE